MMISNKLHTTAFKFSWFRRVVNILMVLSLFTAGAFKYTDTLAQAQTVRIFLSPAYETFPTNTTLSLMLDAGSYQIGFVRIDLTFDPLIIQLMDEIQTTSMLNTVISKTSKNNANSTGSIEIVLAIPPGDQPPTGIIELAKLPIGTVTALTNKHANISVVDQNVQIVDMDETELPYFIEPFTTVLNPTPPPAPGLFSPINNYITNLTTPTFTWVKVPRGDYYEIQIDDTTAFSTPLVQSHKGLSGELSYTAPPLLPGSYYWRVRAYNVNDEPGAWSAKREIVIDTTPPLSPILRTPTDNTSVRGSPLFRWYRSATAVRYQFEYDDNNDFSSPIYTSSELKALAHKPPTPAVGTYYWHVRARDLAGNWSPWSTSRTINILPLIPAASILVSPPKGFVTNDNTPTFTWNPVPYGNTYEVQIATNTTFTKNLQTITIGVGELSFTSNPLANGKYYWRVRAYNVNDEPGAWSAYRYFTVTAP